MQSSSEPGMNFWSCNFDPGTIFTFGANILSKSSHMIPDFVLLMNIETHPDPSYTLHKTSE